MAQADTPVIAGDNRIVSGPLVSGVFTFGLPMAFAMLLHGGFNLVDAWFVGQLPDSHEPLAAIGDCDPILMLATIAANGIATASVAMIARAKGAGDGKAMRVAAGQSLLLVAGISLVLGGLGAAFAGPIASLLGARGNVLTLATSYLQLMFAGIFTMTFLLQFTSILRGAGSSRSPAVILVLANVLNIVLDPFLIDSELFLGIEGGPKMGLLGAGWATVIARFVGCVLAFWLCMRRGERVMPRRGEWKTDAVLLKKLVVLGAPSSAQLIVRVAAMLVFIALVNYAYTTPQDQSVTAAFAIGIRIDMLALFCAMGWGAAATTYVGQNLGAGQPARAARAGWIAAAMAFVFIGAGSAAVAVCAEPIVSLFANGQAKVVTAGTDYLRIVAPSYGLAAASVVFALALNGAGSTRAPAVIDGLVYALLSVPMALSVVLIAQDGQQSVWYTIAGTSAVLAIVYAIWFLAGRWRRIEL